MRHEVRSGALTLQATGRELSPSAQDGMSRRFIDAAERLIVVSAFLWYLIANFQSQSLLSQLIASSDLVTVWFVLTRRPTTSVSLDPKDWSLALAGTLLCMFSRPGGTPLVPPVLVAGLVAEGALISVAAKLSLNRRFGLAPANRGVQMRGAYVFVRHPMYLGYALLHLGYLLVNPTPLNAALLAGSWACQCGRILREERWLMQDRAYRGYARVVRYRIVPGLF